MWISVIAAALLAQTVYWAAFHRGFQRARERERYASRGGGGASSGSAAYDGSLSGGVDEGGAARIGNAPGGSRSGGEAEAGLLDGGEAVGGSLGGGDVQVSVRKDGDVAVPISVVVAVRNEEAIIGRLLQALEIQTHPSFEVIVVDDGSTDGTRDLVRKWTLRLPHFRLLAQEAASKKEALTAGIRAASNALLAFTDADCGPHPTWLATLAREHERRGDCVLIGYSPVRESETGLAPRFARYETFLAGFFMIAAAGLDRPYMAVGRNFSYPRSVFVDVGGFAHSMRSLSGDDDLFVQEVARRGVAPVHAALDRRSFVPTDPPPSLGVWLRAKRRHTSAGRFYSLPAKAHLFAFHASNVLVWMAPLVWGWWGAAALAGRLGWQWYVLRKPARTLGESDLLSALPAYEALYLLYNVVVAPLGLLRMPRTW